MKVLLTLISLVIAFGIKAQTPDTNNANESLPVKVQPQFPGGNKAWSLFLTKNLRFPPDDGTDYATIVFVYFIVEKDGRLTDIKVLKTASQTVCPKCNDEALRVIKLSPHWLPAKVNGKAISSKYTIPIRFGLYDTE